MRIVLSIVVNFLLVFQVAAQVSIISGIVKSMNGEALKDVRVALKQLYIMDITNESGEFELRSVPNGEQIIMAYSVGYRLFEKNLNVQKKDTSIVIILEEWLEELDEVMVSADQAKTFGLSRLNTVQNFAINEGKKTEVITLSEMT
ncbi:MAG: carboxypeptidase-like regulatory domain-containing protein, partial [Bacteroidetes bacterium]|nr:carboxypeptidase-like regulatory domain-containing protein [Bacteroidota bacterium]